GARRLLRCAVGCRIPGPSRTGSAWWIADAVTVLARRGARVSSGARWPGPGPAGGRTHSDAAHGGPSQGTACALRPRDEPPQRIPSRAIRRGRRTVMLKPTTRVAESLGADGEQREAIMAAVRADLDRVGYRRIRLEDVARHAGVSRQTIY